jgi:hypothetical protein
MKHGASPLLPYYCNRRWNPKGCWISDSNTLNASVRWRVREFSGNQVEKSDFVTTVVHRINNNWVDGLPVPYKAPAKAIPRGNEHTITIKKTQEVFI